MDEKNNGVINFLSKNNINLKRVNEIVKGNTIFGDYGFQSEMVDGIKTRTSDEVIKKPSVCESISLPGYCPAWFTLAKLYNSSQLLKKHQ